MVCFVEVWRGGNKPPYQVRNFYGKYHICLLDLQPDSTCLFLFLNVTSVVCVYVCGILCVAHSDSCL